MEKENKYDVMEKFTIESFRAMTRIINSLTDTVEAQKNAIQAQMNAINNMNARLKKLEGMIN